MTKSVIAQASLWTMLFVVATGFGYGLNIPVSRRLANLPYVFWVCAYNCWQVLGFWMVEMFFFGGAGGSSSGAGVSAVAYEERTPRTLRAFNKNGLVVFLVVSKKFLECKSSRGSLFVSLVRNEKSLEVMLTNHDTNRQTY